MRRSVRRGGWRTRRGEAPALRSLFRQALGLWVVLGWAACAPAAEAGGDAARALTARREGEFAAVRLHAAKIRALVSTYQPSAVRDAEVRRELQRQSGRLERARAQPLPPPRAGLSEEAYISPIDDSAQPFYRYLPARWTASIEADGGPPALPLLVYLHGYDPQLDLINWAMFPVGLTLLAEELGACLAMPFGRSNTDYQGIGEQDVLTVVDQMQQRYGTDPRRVVLVGYSMGGMGAWTIGARFSERVAGLLVVAGRADYGVWHGLDLAELPAWERRLVEAQFLPAQASRLRSMPVLAFHGALDPLVRVEEARVAVAHARAAGADARLIVLPEGDHWIIEEALAHSASREWLGEVLASGRPSRPDPLGVRPGELPSRLQNAFLDPFVFVDAGDPASPPDRAVFERRCFEWELWAKAPPRRRAEADLTAGERERLNLFLFGEPEHSPLIRQVLESAGWSIDPGCLRVDGRAFARAGRGLWMAVPSPFAAGRTVVIQMGLGWGAHLPPNHRYDMLPDLLVYSAEAGRGGLNRPLAAARVADDGERTWHVGDFQPGEAPCEKATR